jgi:phosphoribosylformimino-5-aminoimidazole carboxamide ribotide isomerase
VLIYPAIDLKDGAGVRLSQGRFDAVTVYDADPSVRLAAFAAAGATWVHMVDLDGAKAGEPAQYELVGRLAKDAKVKLQVGGGVRARADVERLLNAGVARVVVGSAAVQRPDEVRQWIADLGLDAICLALDVKETTEGVYEVAVRGWTEGSGMTLEAALDLYPEGTLRHVLITDVSRDGILAGPNVPLLKSVVERRPDLQLQASGGVATLEDLKVLSANGAAGAIVGRAIYEGRFTVEEALNAG